MKQHSSSRRQFLSLAGLTACGLSLGSPLKAWQSLKRELFVYVGTYTTGRSEGIYVCRLDLLTGALKQIDVTKGVPNPSFLTVNPKTRFLYAVNEVKEFEGKASGAVSAFSIDHATGALKSSTNNHPDVAAPVTYHWMEPVTSCLSLTMTREVSRCCRFARERWALQSILFSIADPVLIPRDKQAHTLIVW